MKPLAIASATKKLTGEAKESTAEAAIADGTSEALVRLKATVLATSRDETTTPLRELVVTVSAEVGRERIGVDVRMAAGRAGMLLVVGLPWRVAVAAVAVAGVVEADVLGKGGATRLGALHLTAWARRLDAFEKRLRHTWHGKGRAPECVRMCAFRLERLLNRSWHTVHWCGRSPVCIMRCDLRSLDV